MTIKIADFGKTFGMAVSPVFRPWKDGIEYLDTRTTKENISDVVARADLVLLGGGGDIHPALYGAKNVASGVSGDEPSFRDTFEAQVVEYAVKYEKPILGICRGAQMLCVQAGGGLVQHVDGHAGEDHDVLVPDWLLEPLATNSVHHQMMLPFGRGEIIGYTENRSERFLYDTTSLRLDAKNLDVNPEIVWFKRLRGLAIQGHPEFYRNEQHPFVKLTRTLVQRILRVGTDFPAE